MSSEVYNANRQLKHLNRIAIRPKLDLEFQDLIYSVRDTDKGGWRQILNSVNGKFRYGELTAILGPSGAGKTTLLNILAGYVTSGIRGTIKVNNYPRDMKVFNKLSAYIMQEDILQPRLTVKEAVNFAARLKLGADVTQEDKIAVVKEVLNLLGLESCSNTFAEHLSGGERKRLAVALELVNNPPVIFLDEPTSGLDNFAVKQCMSLLKKISALDRTVVCTIHQPPTSLFQLFDQVYIVADGYCVYSGIPSQIVSFLSFVDFPCPSNSTPADYIIELVHLHPSTSESLSIAIQNGKITLKESGDTETLENEGEYGEFLQVAIKRKDTEFATTYTEQLFVLLTRMLLQMKRDRTGLQLQLLHHILSALLVSSIFSGIGQDAMKIIPTVKYCLGCNVFYTYTYVMVPVLLFPLEVQLMRREYFNRWYSLKAYYSALTLSTLPLLIVLSTIFCTIAYFLTDQPREGDRFLGFLLTCIALALTSQGLGYMIGSVFSITGGSVAGPSTLAVLLSVGVYGMGFKQTLHPIYKFLTTLTFIRNGVVGLCSSLYYQRAPLTCYDEDVECFFRRGDEVLNSLQVPVADYRYELIYIGISMVIFRVTSYLLLKCRLNIELSSRVIFCAEKILKRRL